ncbi:MAG: magnesium transporter [Spirochaetia bacterium]|nr:magnesium transporter [Spirochaetia bacterium]
MNQFFDYEIDFNYIALNEKETAHEAIEKLRKVVSEDQVFYAYVVDDYRVLKGVLPLRKLLIAKQDRPLNEFMIEAISCVNPKMSKEEVGEMFRTTKFMALPVVDDAGRILGTITLKKVTEDIREESADEAMKLHGADISVFKAPFLSRLRVKLPWLITTVISGLICGLIMHLFESSLAKIIALSFFIPLITAMGESVGGQSSAIVIEGLILGRLKEKEMAKIISKQLLEGAVMALVIGTGVSLVTIPWLHSPLVAVLTGVTLFITVLIATLNGTIIPMILKKMNINPVVSTNPLVFAITDIMVLLFYFSTAILLMRWMKV